MKTRLKDSCCIKAVAWDNGGVLVQEDWNGCYDHTYGKLGIVSPLGGDAARGKQYKKMLSVPITPEISSQLVTFRHGDSEGNYLQSYGSGHISSAEFWSVACHYGFGVAPTDENVDALRAGQDHLLSNGPGAARIFPRVVEILAALSAALPQYMLSNIYPEAYEQLRGAKYLEAIPADHRFFSIFLKCRKPSAAAFEALIAGTGVAPRGILFIDDQASNIEAARCCGINGILFSGERESEQVLIAGLERFGIIVSG